MKTLVDDVNYVPTDTSHALVRVSLAPAVWGCAQQCQLRVTGGGLGRFCTMCARRNDRLVLASGVCGDGQVDAVSIALLWVGLLRYVEHNQSYFSVVLTLRRGVPRVLRYLVRAHIGATRVARMCACVRRVPM